MEISSQYATLTASFQFWILFFNIRSLWHRKWANCEKDIQCFIYCKILGIQVGPNLSEPAHNFQALGPLWGLHCLACLLHFWAASCAVWTDEFKFRCKNVCYLWKGKTTVGANSMTNYPMKFDVCTQVHFSTIVLLTCSVSQNFVTPKYMVIYYTHGESLDFLC